jgi:DNA-binding transcriptional LysR family regulator
MNATIDLNRVAVFLRVVESGSFTGAAQALELPKSSVSRSVQHLEDSLGVQLLQRTTRKLHLTDAGRLYYEQARIALSQLGDAGAAVSSMRAEPRGTVRVTAPPDLGVIALPEIVADFVAKYPKVQIDVSLSSRTVDLVQEGVDIAIRAGRLGDSSLVARKVAMAELGLFASKRYLAKRGTPKKLVDLKEHDCVLFRAPTHRATWRLTGPSGEEKVDVTGPVSVDDIGFVSRAIACDLGIGLVPAFHCGARRDVERVLPTHALGGAQFSVVTPSTRHQPAAVTLFRDFVTRRLQEFPWFEAGKECAKAEGRRKRR